MNLIDLRVLEVATFGCALLSISFMRSLDREFRLGLGQFRTSSQWVKLLRAERHRAVLMQNIVVAMAETSAIASGQKGERAHTGSFAREGSPKLVAGSTDGILAFPFLYSLAAIVV